ncbi:tyrosine--tRNA ligase [Agrobacterium vitis]|uniref:Tyrosine--tRNA ligase n=1 Tax=Agrobacterium vitis TaxID=373 RepID=A0AAE2RCV5_AGRVI|nr:tyrosine--tRNA ligase [Agrobacterium vitis]MBF2714326.1 tyrosine--tRNA ligase [Agrobacterium vitis]MVA21988.1 tyrosine--tRNA ligase [Agrobacterium vitis]
MLDFLLSDIAIMEPKNGLQDKLELAEKQNRKLRIKLGFDPTAPDLHLGHAVVLRKLREFQQCGHKIVVIIGDFTAMIGDPTGRNKTRPPLSDKEVSENAETYIRQLGKIIDVNDIEVRRNSEWHSALDLARMIKLLSKVTVAQILQREDFRKRLDADLPIYQHELLYPILQGYDSIMVNADIELGGTDQLFNNLMGRTLQESHGQLGQAVITMPLLVGTDGTDKMSKSKANYIGLTEDPENIYGKIMSIPDSLAGEYVRLTTTFDAIKKQEMLDKLANGENPMVVKKAIAENVVASYYSADIAAAAAAHFQRTVQNRNPSTQDYQILNLPEIRKTLPEQPTFLDLCHFAMPQNTRSQIRRLITEGGVRVNGEKIENFQTLPSLDDGLKLQIGRRNLFILAEKDH